MIGLGPLQALQQLGQSAPVVAFSHVLLAVLHLLMLNLLDRCNQCRYVQRLDSFKLSLAAALVLDRSRQALEFMSCLEPASAVVQGPYPSALQVRKAIESQR